jgi:hypothetical protein
MFDQTKFDKEFDTPFFRGETTPMTYAKRIIIGAVLLFILMVSVNAVMISNGLKEKNKHFYTISITTYRGEDNYWSDSIVSQTDRSIHFIDQFGFDKTVSGNYISVTKLK